MKSDKQLQEEIIKKLDESPMVQSSEIAVSVKHGEVTVSGYVNSTVEKLWLLKAIEKVVGIRKIIVELVTRLPYPLNNFSKSLDEIVLYQIQKLN